MWILLKQETVSGNGISWAICKSAPCSRQITTPAPRHSVFYRPDNLPAAQPTASKHWRQLIENEIMITGTPLQKITSNTVQSVTGRTVAIIQYYRGQAWIPQSSQHWCQVVAETEPVREQTSNHAAIGYNPTTYTPSVGIHMFRHLNNKYRLKV